MVKSMQPLALSPDVLKQRLREQRDLFNQSHSTRLHRAISWWQAALDHSADDDMRFIAAWISFSACVVTDRNNLSLAEQSAFNDFIARLVALDSDERIYDCLWHQYSGSVKALIKNPYVFAPFWQSQRSGDEHWKSLFDQSSVAALNALSRRKVPELLAIVLDRLCVLHQQVVNGGATYKSQVNRDQVIDGGNLLLTLMPIIIAIMLDAADQEWGELAYPVVGNASS
ncbi:hypothetical protein [Thalassolituus oleivorans]|uniref:hypothetical protein n=1 Tax=Thalassolituus oleivorans TaxID=187493 RepID=UPI001E32C55D|nr:hypothetical protein [Thalassolituus oleivorans]